MIALDPIARIIGQLAAAGYEACRASDLETKPEAAAGPISGKFQTEGIEPMTDEQSWEEAIQGKLDELADVGELAKALAAKVCGENYTQEQFGLAYEVVRQRALLQEAEQALRDSRPQLPW